MERKEFLFDGKAKQLYSTDDPNFLIITYKDDISAFDGLKRSSIPNKGILNNYISELIYQELERHGVKTHFVKRLDDRNQLCKKLEVYRLHVIVRNRIAGSAAHRLELEEGLRTPIPIMEINMKDDFLKDPMINDYYAVALGIIEWDELQAIYQISDRINQTLCGMFDKIGIDVIDFKLEFGKDKEGNIVLADEINPDTARFWDKATNDKLDRDRFKRNMGKIEESYRKIYDLLSAHLAEK